MKKAIFFVVIVVLVLLFAVQLAEDTKAVFVSSESAEPNKLGPINFGIKENKELPEQDENRFSVFLSVPTPAPTLPPIPTPTPEREPDPRLEEAMPYSIIVDISKQLISIMTMDEDGYYTNLYKQFKCSTGLGATPTVTGSFKVKKKAPWLESYPTITQGGGEYQVYARYRTTIYDDYHFHSILYQDKMDFRSMTRTSFYNLGRRASHGCIRLTTRDAKWIYTNCDIGTPIRIRASGGPDFDETKFVDIPFYRDLPGGVYYDPTDLAQIEKVLNLED